MTMTLPKKGSVGRDVFVPVDANLPSFSGFTPPPSVPKSLGVPVHITLTEDEIALLAHLCGYPQQGHPIISPWGAAISEIIEHLKSVGLVALFGTAYKPTSAGVVFFEQLLEWHRETPLTNEELQSLDTQLDSDASGGAEWTSIGVTTLARLTHELWSKRAQLGNRDISAITPEARVAALTVAERLKNIRANHNRGWATPESLIPVRNKLLTDAQETIESLLAPFK